VYGRQDLETTLHIRMSVPATVESVSTSILTAAWRNCASMHDLVQLGTCSKAGSGGGGEAGCPGWGGCPRIIWACWACIRQHGFHAGPSELQLGHLSEGFRRELATWLTRQAHQILCIALHFLLHAL